MPISSAMSYDPTDPIFAAQQAQDMTIWVFEAEMMYKSNYGSGEYGSFSDLQRAGLINSESTSSTLAEGYEICILPSEFPDDRPLVVALPNTTNTQQLVGFVTYRNRFSDTFNNGPILSDSSYLLPLDSIISGRWQEWNEINLREIIHRVESGGELTRLDDDVILYGNGRTAALFYSRDNTSLIYFGGVMYLVIPMENAMTENGLIYYQQTELVRIINNQAVSSIAESMLKSLGNCELAHYSVNGGMYGYLTDLQKDSYVNPGYTFTTLVEGYTFHFFLTGDRQHFLVVAGGGIELPCFAISDDQILLRLNPVTESAINFRIFERYVTDDSSVVSGGFTWAYLAGRSDDGCIPLFFSGQEWVGVPVM